MTASAPHLSRSASAQRLGMRELMAHLADVEHVAVWGGAPRPLVAGAVLVSGTAG